MKLTVALVIAAIVVPTLLVSQSLFWAKGNDIAVTIDVTEGMTAREIGRVLVENRAIESEFAFRVYLKLHPGEERFQVGSYALQEGMSVRGTVNALTVAAAAKEKTLRIIEGWTLRDIAKEVERQGFGTQAEFFRLTGEPAMDYRKSPVAETRKDWSREFPVLADKPGYVSLEGYLFPDTYRFAEDATAEDVVRRLLQEFDRKFTADMRAEAARQHHSIFEIVTLASVIEKEVQSDTDRKLAADLFWRRLDLGWGMQADSTVHYVFPTDGKTVFTTAQERASDSLYNTYKYRGLPLGPISNPGLASLQATLTPTPNQYWYYLTTPSGEVKYAKTLEEHNANKRFMH